MTTLPSASVRASIGSLLVQPRRARTMTIVIECELPQPQSATCGVAPVIAG